MNRRRALVLAPVLAVLSACQQQPPSDPQTPSPSAAEPVRHEMAEGTAGASSATAELKPLGGSGVTGRIAFAQVEGGVRVTGEVRGLAPSSTHGFHVHEKGDCSAPDGSSAGGHFDPTHKSHGAPDSAESHIGDLGNLTSDAQGTAQISLLKRGATLDEGETSYLGKGVIVHTSPDDLKTQPTGNAGGRVACGVIEKQ